VVLDGENTVQFPYKSTWSEAEDFEMKLSQPAVEYAHIPKDRKQQYLQKNMITVTTRWNLPASSVCCSFLQGQNATKHVYVTRKHSWNPYR